MAKKIGYLVSEFPAPSHTFIRREVDVLRAKGLDVRTFSVHKPDAACRFGTDDLRALETTRYLFPLSPWKVFSAHIWALTRSPKSYVGAWVWAMKHAAPGLKEYVWKWFYFYEAIVLACMLRDAEITHLHSHFANSAARVGIIASKYLGISWSITLHGAADWAYPNGYLLPEKVAEASFVACVSHFTRSQAMWRTPMSAWGKMFVCRCGIDLSVFERATDRLRERRTFRIVNIGRLVPEKAQVGLIDAVTRLRARGHSIELRIVGAGPLEMVLSNQIAACGLGDCCTLVGQLTEAEVKEELARADAFVMTSLMEGLPVVLMEAMAMRVPVVAPGVAGIPELVEHAQTGLLFFPGDWDDLAKKVYALVDDAELGDRLAEAGYARVKQNHDIAKSLDELSERFVGLM